MACCGQKRNTPCCPMCGRHLLENPMTELLIYIRNTIAKFKKHLTNTVGKTSEKYIRYAKYVNKWTQYETELVELIERNINDSNELPTLNIKKLTKLAMIQALAKTDNNREMAAKLTGLAERTFYRKLNSLKGI